MTDGSSLNQSAFPAKNTGFLKKLRIVSWTRSTIKDLYLCILNSEVYFLLLGSSEKNY